MQFEALKSDQKTLEEYVRRYRKGLPSDRWTDGVDGERRHAEALERYMAMTNFIAALLEQKYEDELARGADAMEPHSDPCRSDGEPPHDQ